MTLILESCRNVSRKRRLETTGENVKCFKCCRLATEPGNLISEITKIEVLYKLILAAFVNIN